MDEHCYVSQLLSTGMLKNNGKWLLAATFPCFLSICRGGSPTTTVPGISAKGATYAAGGWPGTCAAELLCLLGILTHAGRYGKREVTREQGCFMSAPLPLVVLPEASVADGNLSAVLGL